MNRNYCRYKQHICFFKQFFFKGQLIIGWKGLKRHLLNHWHMHLTVRMLKYWHQIMPFPFLGLPGQKKIFADALNSYIKKHLKKTRQNEKR